MDLAGPQLEVRSPESSALCRKQPIKIQQESRAAAAGALLSISDAASADDTNQHGFNHGLIQDFFTLAAAGTPATALKHTSVSPVSNSGRPQRSEP